jgi:hypothetical protein
MLPVSEKIIRCAAALAKLGTDSPPHSAFLAHLNPMSGPAKRAGIEVHS